MLSLSQGFSYTKAIYLFHMIYDRQTKSFMDTTTAPVSPHSAALSLVQTSNSYFLSHPPHKCYTGRFNKTCDARLCSILSFQLYLSSSGVHYQYFMDFKVQAKISECRDRATQQTVHRQHSGESSAALFRVEAGSRCGIQSSQLIMIIINHQLNGPHSAPGLYFCC